MTLNAGNVLKINVTSDPKDTILEYIQKYLNKPAKVDKNSSKIPVNPLVIVTPNPEQIVLATRDFHFAKLLNQADISLPDGIGVVLASKILGKPRIQKRIQGVEFMQDLTAMAARNGVTIGLIGGREGLAVETLKCLQSTYPRLTGWAEQVPDIFIEKNELQVKNYDEEMKETYFANLAKRIQKEKIGILFVGLGAPKQEYFIEAINSRLLSLDVGILLMSVGGSFDLISGNIKRAPHLVRMIGFEWAWRLVQQPWRWKRQLALLKFMWLVLKSKLHI